MMLSSGNPAMTPSAALLSDYRTAQAAAAADARRLCDITLALAKLHEAALSCRRAVEKRAFYFMVHSGFVACPTWLPQLEADLPPRDERQLLISGEYLVVTFGVAANTMARINQEFFSTEALAFRYPFQRIDAKEVPWMCAADDSGATDVNGGDVEKPLKAMLAAANKRHAHGIATRAALRCAGVVPFDHPVCAAAASAAPDGIKDETVLLSKATWARLSQCTCTNDLLVWVTELQRNVAADAAVTRAAAALT